MEPLGDSQTFDAAADEGASYGDGSPPQMTAPLVLFEQPPNPAFNRRHRRWIPVARRVPAPS